MEVTDVCLTLTEVGLRVGWGCPSMQSCETGLIKGLTNTRCDRHS